MNKPDALPMLPSQPAISGQAIPAPQAVVQQSPPVAAVQKQVIIPPTRATRHSDAIAPYVDPYLFETGYYASPTEYEALSRTAASRILFRADAENARPKRITKK